jgi:hypothetical protein
MGRPSYAPQRAFRSRATPEIQHRAGDFRARTWRISVDCAIIAPYWVKSRQNVARSLLTHMTRTQELKALEAALREATDGSSLADLQILFPGIPKRTLQRRLATLLADDSATITGNGPARRYHAIRAGQRMEPIEADEIPLGSAGLAVRALVRRPVAQRIPVGYRREFLDGYEPNVDFYLPAGLRERLHEMGRSPASGRPAGTYARQMLDRLLIDLSWSSSRLEGNTYTRLDTQNLIEFGRLADGKDRLQAQVILNHKAAIEMLVEQADDVGFNRYTLQNLHALLAQNLLANSSAEGRLRRIEVAISGTVFQPLAIPQQIEEYFDRILGKAAAIADPFEQAFFAMVHIPYLQPFEDVNKRVSRLSANIPLIRANLAPLSFVDVPERTYVDGTLGVYELARVELLRDVFEWAYERSCRRFTVIRESLPEPDPFRMRHRQALIDVIGDVIGRHVALADSAAIRVLAATRVDADAVDEFMALVVNELHHLHEGNIARYRVRPSLFREWASRNRSADA